MGFVVLVGAYMTAAFGVVPSVGVGLVAGNDDARYRVAKDLHLAGIGWARDVLARMIVAALSVIALWLAGVVASVIVALAYLIMGTATLRSAASPDSATDQLIAREALASGAVSLPLLAALCVLVAVALKSSLRAGVVVLGTTALWFASICFVSTLPELLWLARFTPIGAAYQISTLSTFPRGDERFGVSVPIAVMAGVVWFVCVPLLALWGASRQLAAETPGRQPEPRECASSALTGACGETAASMGAQGDFGERHLTPAALSRRPNLRLTIAAVVVGAVCLGIAADARVLSGAYSFDGAYQWFAGQREGDVMARVAQDISDGSWNDASALVGGDIEELSPELVTYVRRHPAARIESAWGWLKEGDRIFPGVEFWFLESSEAGIVHRLGPTYCFEMTFRQGHWIVHDIFKADS